MALQSTTKIRLFVSSQKEEEVFSFLQDREVMELVPVNGSVRSDVCHNAEFSAAKLDFAIRYLSAFAPKKKGLRNAVLGEKIELSSEGCKKSAQFDWEAVVEKVSALEGEKNDVSRGLAESNMVLSSLLSFEGVEVESKEGNYSPSFFVVPVKAAKDFLEKVIALSPYLEISEVSQTEANVSFVLFARSGDKKNVTTLLSEAKGSEVVLEGGLSPAQKIVALQEDIASLQVRLDKNIEDSGNLTDSLDALKANYDVFASKKEMNVARRLTQTTDSVSVAEGWVETEKLAAVKADLSDKFGAIEVEEIAKEEKERSPVVLKNSKWVQPFEVVTDMFGTPGEKELDPTPFLAPFFVVFFGLCLTDAAYGLMLTLAMGAILSAKLPLDFGVRKIITLLFFAGLSTTFFGVLFGGWFGIDPNAAFIPEFLTYIANSQTGELMFLGQVLNPADDLVSKIAPLVLLAGVVHLLLGVSLKGYLAWKNNHAWDTFMVAIPTVLTIVAGLLFALSGEGMVFADSTEILKNVTLVAFAFMTVGIMKSGGPIAWFMDVTGWLSNTLSYARLFALGLATGVVAQVFNTVALTIGGMMPTGLNIIVILFILLFGHSLNIALNLLGAFVHSGRLQFVEFFGQFLDGGGKSFSPLKRINRFIHKA